MPQENITYLSGSRDEIIGYKRGVGISKVQLAAVVFVLTAAGLGVGLLVGKFGICQPEDKNDGDVKSRVLDRLVSEADPTISQLIMDGIDPHRIEENLRLLTRKPHIAGRPNDFELVKLLQQHFKDNGLLVQTAPYDVLLSYPSETTPNSVRLVDGRGHVVYDSVTDESDISHLPDVVPPFHAYSANSLVEGQIVFVGYGRHLEYESLLKLGINVTGHLVLVKYGKLFRGDKVAIAASYGATGVIMYTDPDDYTGFKSGDRRVYPETWWMPPNGAQRGTILLGEGDPLTPGYPANDLAFRYAENEVDPPMPQIPSHPIGYGAAYNIIRYLNGSNVPSGWQGALNITYRTGPGFTQPGMKIQLNVTSRNERVKAENVFGIIRGSSEPDRYVLFGNHRDAWIYGALDPSSGTAILMELARVMGGLVKSGKWRPRRSMVFCSWGAEEYGLIGSTEWVEQYVALLRERAVAYINVDIAVQGNNTLRVSSTPLMYNIVYEASKKVPNPNTAEIQAGRKTVYDTWLQVTPQTDHENTLVPAITTLGSGSDYAPLLQRAGITAIDLRYSYDRKLYDVPSYPLYHTEYEIFDVVKEQFDRDFQFHAAMAKVVGEMSRSLADSLLLPFKLLNYANGLDSLRKILDREYGSVLSKDIDNYDRLAEIIQGFTEDVLSFETRLKTIDTKDPLAIRAANDQMLLLERAFLDPAGLPERPLKKHVIFAEDAHDSYAGTSFPGLVDLLFEIEKHPERWEKVRHHFSVILQIIQSAGATLRDVTNFMPEIP
ncbi:unnamed protein product [Lymnaea stagnalis]|uniref:Uncharacterized protein n=1 Tax=Lymnaea stagnalis TaxID=6523 RepID=A0AAV2IEQ6_LYMST